jgi:hypothetical protein
VPLFPEVVAMMAQAGPESTTGVIAMDPPDPWVMASVPITVWDCPPSMSATVHDHVPAHDPEPLLLLLHPRSATSADTTTTDVPLIPSLPPAREVT